MSKRLHSLEDLLRSNLSGKTTQVPDMIWVKVMHDINRKKRRKRFFLLATFSVSLCSIITLVFINSTKTQNETNANPERFSFVTQSQPDQIEGHKVKKSKHWDTKMNAASMHKVSTARLKREKKRSTVEVPVATEQKIATLTETVDGSKNITKTLQQKETREIIDSTPSTEIRPISEMVNEFQQKNSLTNGDGVDSLFFDSPVLISSNTSDTNHLPEPQSPLKIDSDDDLKAIKTKKLALATNLGYSSFSLSLFDETLKSQSLSKQFPPAIGLEANFNIIYLPKKAIKLVSTLSVNVKRSELKQQIYLNDIEYQLYKDQPIPISKIGNKNDCSCLMEKEVGARYSIFTIFLDVGAQFKIYQKGKITSSIGTSTGIDLLSRARFNNINGLDIKKNDTESFKSTRLGAGTSLDYALNHRMTLSFSPKYFHVINSKNHGFYNNNFSEWLFYIGIIYELDKK